MSVDDAIKAVATGKLTLEAACRATGWKCTTTQLMLAVRKFKIERAAKIGKKGDWR